MVKLLQLQINMGFIILVDLRTRVTVLRYKTEEEAGIVEEAVEFLLL